MPFLELFDETLDINSTENYELSVQISNSGLSYSLIDTIRNKFILLRSFEQDENKKLSSDDLKEFMNNDDFLAKKYKKVNVITATPKFTLVPAPLYDPVKKEEYFTFNHILEENNIVIANKVKATDAFLLFSLSQPVYNIVKDFYPTANPQHHIKVLLECTPVKSIPDGNYVRIHVESDFFNLIIYEANNLKFSNTFNYRNISDILYYVLNVFKSMNMDKKEVVYFSGMTEKHDDIYSNFAQYIRNIMFAEPTVTQTYSYVFNDLELHRFVNLLSVASCE